MGVYFLLIFNTHISFQYNNEGNLVIPSIFAVIPLLRGNNDAIDQQNLRNLSAYIITKETQIIIGRKFNVSHI